MSAAISTGWAIGWAVGAVVVVIAAVLLLAIIGLGRRIVVRADEITAALDGARTNTSPLYDLTKTNVELERIEAGLRGAREGGAAR